MVSASAPPWVSIVIVAYNAGEFLQQCLDALAAQTAPEFEAIVVDNASTDGSVQRLCLPDERFRVVAAGGNLGFAAGSNRGVVQARADWVATLNPDAIAAPDWLAELQAATQRHPHTAMFGSTQVNAEDPGRLDGCGDALSVLGVPWRGGYGHPLASKPPEGEVFSPCAAAALYRRDAFAAVGGFDERFFCYLEDLDLAFRIRLKGGVCVQVPDAIVRHVGSATSGAESHFTLYHSARNRVWLMLKNLPAALLASLLPLHLAYMTFILWQRRRAKGEYTAATRAGLRAAFADLGPVWRARRDIQRGRRMSTFAVARMLTWNPYKLWRCETDIRPLPLHSPIRSRKRENTPSSHAAV